MEWNLMEPYSSANGGLVCLVEDIYLPADNCQAVLDDMIEMVLREDPKLRNGRRKLALDKFVEKDLVPLIIRCTDEDIIARSLRLLANLTQPLEVFVQLGVPLGEQCQREINTLVSRAKTCCSKLDFFSSLHCAMEKALTRDDQMVHPSDSELLNYALLLLRNLLHTCHDDNQTSETSTTLQSILSSFFVTEMDKLVLKMLNHPQKADWVVSNVQLLSLIFKSYAGTLLENNGEEEDRGDSDRKSDVGSVSYVFEFIPSQTSKLLAQKFDKQLQIGEVPIIAGKLITPQSDEGTDDLLQGCDATGSTEDPEEIQERAENKMLTDEETDQNDSVADSENSYDSMVPPVRALFNTEEKMQLLNARVKILRGRSTRDQGISECNSSTGDQPDKQTKTEKLVNQLSIDSDSGRPESSEEEKQEERTASEREGEGDSGVEAYLPRQWETSHTQLFEEEREIKSELASGSCLMDREIIVAYMRTFATDIVCSGLNNLVESLMKVLLNSQEGVLEDSFFMWTVGFFLSFARHTHIEFNQYRYLLNLDVFGFLTYQGYLNCDILTGQILKEETCLLTKYRLHLVVCTLNQLFDVILTHNREMEEDDGDYMHTLQMCLAPMADLRRLFVLLLHSHKTPYDMVYLRDLIYTNHNYLLLLEGWVSHDYVPQPFCMLSHIKLYASADVMQKYGRMLEQYNTNNELLNVAIMTVMYHIAGDCKRDDLLIQLPILKTFSEMWGDSACNKYVEFKDLVKFTLETFMSMAFKDPKQCAQKLFNMTFPEDVDSDSSSEYLEDIGGLTEEEQDLLFTWTTDLQGSVNMVDDLVARLHSHGSSATRLLVMIHLLQDGGLEEHQMEALFEEINEIHELSGKAKKRRMVARLSDMDQDQLLPFVLERMQDEGSQEHVQWLQDQLLEAAYVRLGARNNKYRVHVEEPLARFHELLDKSIPLVTVNEEEDRAVRDPYFTTLLQGLGLFPADATPSCVFCRIPQFLTPAQLLSKAQQLGDVDLSCLKFDLTEVQDELNCKEFSPLSKDHNYIEQQERRRDTEISPLAPDQMHKWRNNLSMES